MKKKLSVLIALIMVLAVALPVMAACETEKVVKSLDFDNPQKNYTVGDTIDYDSWKVKITYTDGTTATKTVKELVADGATLTKADLTKEGTPTVYLVYKEITARVVLTVTAAGGGNDDDEPLQVSAYTAPDFYTEYTSKSAPRTGNETTDDFRITGESYEVGTANKFIFRPTVKALDLNKGENGEEVEDNNPATTVKVYAGSAKGTYTELTGDELTNFVTVEDNTYKFSKGGDKYVKLEISLDADKYDVSQLSDAQKVITVEFVLIDDGYNAYDQRGLSVMADLEKRAWSEIWKCDTKVEGNVVKCIANENSLKLDADDDYLCNYVDNVSTVILHNTITLNPDEMPSLFFWTSSEGLVTSDLYTTAWDSIKTLEPFASNNDKLVGTLRSGDNSGDNGGSKGDRNYMRVIDTELSDNATEGDYKVNGSYAIDLGFSLNMQRSLFATKKVSVSGNYQSILTPEKGARSAGGRLLEMYVDWDDGTAVTDPVSHWAIFQMLQSKHDGVDKAEFEIRNLALEGNNPRSETSGFTSAGLMMLDSYTTSLSFKNVNASQFFNMMNGDDYGEIKFADGKVTTGESGSYEDAIINLNGAKLYNAYSNMIYLWRSTAKVVNSELIGSGGPLFILCDGPHKYGESSTTDQGGPEFEVDSISVLQAYAFGGESWYKTWNANVLFDSLGTNIEPVVQALGKTMYVKSEGGHNYINVIAAIICEPGSLLTGGSATDVNGMFDVRGKFTQYDAEGKVANQFAMHNPYLMAMRAQAIAGGANPTPAHAFAPILQAGNNAVAITGATVVGGQTIPTLYRFTGENVDDAYQNLVAEATAWATNNSNKLCIYMSAGAPNGAAYAPYFGVVVDLNNKAGN